MNPRNNYAPYILRSTDDLTTAKCVKCLEEKILSEYYKHSVRKDGFIRYRQICKVCRKRPKRNKPRPIYENIIKNNSQICLKCKIKKPLNDFYKNGCFDDGLPKYRSTCKSCILLMSPEKHKETYSEKIIKKHSSYKNYISTLLNHSSKRRKEFNIDIQYLIDLYESQNGLCNISGVKMTYDHGKKATNISIDRINNNIGYVKGNIQLTCYIANIMKSTFSIIDFMDFCEKIVNYNKNKKNGI
jgi:hypothetical protein